MGYMKKFGKYLKTIANVMKSSTQIVQNMKKGKKNKAYRKKLVKHVRKTEMMVKKPIQECTPQVRSTENITAVAENMSEQPSKSIRNCLIINRY